jgi:NADH-quinone oxidoreductase subunit K
MQPDQTILMATGTVLLLLGIASVSFSKNLIKSIMAFQVAVFGANLTLYTSGLLAPPDVQVHVFVILAILVGAAVEATGLALIVTVYRKYRTLNPAEIRRLR